MQVVGVGGGGSNAVNRMLANQLTGVEMYVMNTDAQVSACSQGLGPSLRRSAALQTALTGSATATPAWTEHSRPLWGSA